MQAAAIATITTTGTCTPNQITTTAETTTTTTTKRGREDSYLKGIPTRLSYRTDITSTHESRDGHTTTTLHATQAMATQPNQWAAITITTPIAAASVPL